VDQPVRVLLLEGKPYWDTKFLVRHLVADPSVALTSVVQLAEGRLPATNHSAPGGGGGEIRGGEFRSQEQEQTSPTQGSQAGSAGDREQWTIEKDAENSSPTPLRWPPIRSSSSAETRRSF